MAMKMSVWQAPIEAIQKNKAFEAFVIFVIMVAAVSVGAKTYNIPTPVLNLLGVLDRVIILVFVIELTIRFVAIHPRYAFFKNAWNVFDALVVAISLIPIEGSDMALVARLARVFRVIRMASIVPEAKLLLNSLLKAMPRLIYVMAMMSIIFYIYGAFGSLFFESVNPVLWGDVGVAMLTLFQVMTFDDWANSMYATMEIYWWSWLYYLSFIFLTAFAFLNMVIGIIVNVLEEEHEQVITDDPNKISNENLYQEIQKIKLMLQSQNRSPDST